MSAIGDEHVAEPVDIYEEVAQLAVHTAARVPGMAEVIGQTAVEVMQWKVTMQGLGLDAPIESLIATIGRLLRELASPVEKRAPLCRELLADLLELAESPSEQGGGYLTEEVNKLRQRARDLLVNA